MAKKKAQTDAATVIGSEENDTATRHSLLKSRLRVAKAFSKKPHKAWKRWIAEYEIDDIGDTEEIRDKVRIGYIFRKTESELPAIFDDQPDLFIKGRSPALRELEGLFEGLYDYLWDVQSLDEKLEHAGLYFVLLGMAFVESPYVTKNKKIIESVPQETIGEDGLPIVEMIEQEYEVPLIDNPVADVVDPFKIHFSPETKFNMVLDYKNCPYYFKEHTMTVEEIKARFGKDVDPEERLHIEGDIEIDTEIDSEMKEHKDDFKRVTVYEYYGVLPEEKIKGIKDAGAWEYDKDYHIWMTANEELLAEESPYEVKPCFIIGNYGTANKFWKFGDAKHLMPLVQELEQYRSQILNHTRKMANPRPLIELNSEVDESAFRDPRVGKAVKYSGIKPEYLSPAPLGREVSTGVEMARTDLEKTSPSFDLAGGGGQSQVKTPRGIQIFSEASDRGIRRKRKKFARFIRQLIIFQFGQVAAFWQPDDMKRIEVDGEEEPITAEVLQVLSDPQVLNKLDIEIESLSVNRVQMKQEALELFDMAANHPQIFNLQEIARDVLQNGYQKKDADRYMFSEEERLMQALQMLVQMMNQVSPEAAMVLAQMAQDPQVIGQLTAGGEGQSSAPQVQAPAQDNMPPLPEV